MAGVTGAKCCCNDQQKEPQACCFEDGECQFLTPTECIAQGGVPQGLGTTCTPNPCGVLEGNCCGPAPAHTCLGTIPVDECQQLGGSIVPGAICATGHCDCCTTDCPPTVAIFFDFTVPNFCNSGILVHVTGSGTVTNPSPATQCIYNQGLVTGFIDGVGPPQPYSTASIFLRCEFAGGCCGNPAGPRWLLNVGSVVAGCRIAATEYSCPQGDYLVTDWTTSCNCTTAPTVFVHVT